MIARIIENWLTNTNESFVRTAFCQLLLDEGHNVKNIHGSLEHGKDIISIDSNGDYHAYQLKKGDIDIRAWREIKPQIDELVEYPIDHVGFDPEKGHIPYLVISGNINSVANNGIRLYNQSKLQNNYPALKIIDKNELLERLTESQVKFIPKEFDDFYTLLDLLTIDGTNFLPKKQFLEFLDRVIFNEVPYYFNDKLNAISSSLILLSYLLERFQESKNYYALFEAWIILAGCIIKFGKRANLSNEDYESSLELVIANVIDTLELLKDEILTKKNFFEGNGSFDSDKTYGARVIIILGTLACLELYSHQKNEEYEKDSDFLELIKDKIDYALFWGESAFPYYFYLIKYLEFCNEDELSNSLLEKIFLDIIEKNHIHSKETLPNVYYDVNAVIESLIREDIELYIKKNQNFNLLMNGIQNNPSEPVLAITRIKLEDYGLRGYLSGSQTPYKVHDIYETNNNIFSELSANGTRVSHKSKLTEALEKILTYSNLGKIDSNLFSGSSYILEIIVLMLARRGKREILAENWRKISHMLYNKMILDDIEDTFTWHTRNGHNISVKPKEEQSWKELVNKTEEVDSLDLYNEFLDILQFYIIAVPHRANEDIIGLLDIELIHE